MKLSEFSRSHDTIEQQGSSRHTVVRSATDTDINITHQGEIEGIKSGVRKRIEIWSPYKAKLSKKQLL